jgi:hypothetical protein
MKNMVNDMTLFGKTLVAKANNLALIYDIDPMLACIILQHGVTLLQDELLRELGQTIVEE